MPEFPVATVILVGFVIADVATGFVVSQEKLILQLLLFRAITQERAAGVSVPDIAPAAHIVPFQKVPEAQVALLVA